jgi:hypothetical protein
MSRKIRSPVMDNFGTLCCETKKGAIAATIGTQLFKTS